MAQIDLDDIKRQILALSATTASQKARAEKLRALSLQKRKAAEQLLRPALAQAGPDIVGLREKVLHNARTFRDEVERARAPHADAREARKAAFQRSVDLRRAALGKAGRHPAGPVHSHVEYLPEPIYIGESIPPVDPLPRFLRDSSISPYDSRARIYIATDVGFSMDGFAAYYGPWFDFWYIWSSNSSLESQLSITAPLVYSGTVYLELVPAEIYWLWNRLDFGIFSTLTTYQLGNQQTLVPSPVVTPLYLATYPFTDDSRFIPLEHLTSIVQNPYVVVPPNGTLLIRVSAVFHWEFRNGWGPDDGEPGNLVRCDFSDNDSDYFVQSPFVAVAVTGPIVAEPTVSG
jgi:hypothetical protein